MALTVWTAATTAATPTPAQQAGASRTVLASLADTRNRTMVDAGPDDFVVTESGHPREVLSVRIADYPIVVLLDTSGNARRDLDDMRKAVARLVSRLGQRPIVVGTIGHPAALLTTFEDDRQKIDERLSELKPSTLETPLVLEGVADAARMLHELGTPFSAIVVVSGSIGDASGGNTRELLRTILESGAFVHAVADRTVGGPLRNEALNELTDQTRGQFTRVFSSASFGIALDRLADRLATELMIEYLVPSGSAGTDVKLGVRIPGARVTGLGVR